MRWSFCDCCRKRRWERNRAYQIKRIVITSQVGGTGATEDKQQNETPVFRRGMQRPTFL